MTPQVTFATSFAFVDDAIVLACARDDLADFARETRVFQYSFSRPPHWWVTDVEYRVRSLAYFGPSTEDFDDFVALSEDGEVRYFVDGSPFVEKISGAGVNCDDWGGWGYVADIQQIGERLYVCGYKGQVYRRNGPNDWVHADNGLLQDPDTPTEATIALSVINGPHENAIYAAGYRHDNWLPACAFFFDGSSWKELELPPVAERIINMYIESEERVWMCGSNGTLLLGNATDGFKSLSTVEDNQLFTSVCKYRELIFLGSNLGLFFYDPAKPQQGIKGVATNLTPELQDANIVDCAGEVLWSIGPKDIARFDGKKWERIHHPDNPKIG